jgi:hypothetical protein
MNDEIERYKKEIALIRRRQKAEKEKARRAEVKARMEAEGLVKVCYTVPKVKVKMIEAYIKSLGV